MITSSIIYRANYGIMARSGLVCEAASSPSEAGPRSFHPQLSLQHQFWVQPWPELKVKWMRVKSSRARTLSRLVILTARDHIHHSVTSLCRGRSQLVNQILNSSCPFSEFSLATLKEIRIYLEAQKTFNTTAGVIRQGEVSRPASGAQLPRANQQQRWIPTSARRDELPQEKEQIQNDAVFRRVRGILNKVGFKLLISLEQEDFNFHPSSRLHLRSLKS